MTVRVTVTGQKAVLAALVRELGPEMTAKAAAGLKEAADFVQHTAVDSVTDHHWHGGLESGITAHNVEIDPDGSVSVEVGSAAPQARAFEAGWFSRAGQQPPAAALEAWVSSKGIGEQGQTPAQAAFVIARSIGANSKGLGGHRYGFSFPGQPLKYLVRAIQRRHKLEILEILIRALRA